MIEVTSEKWAEFICRFRYICCGSGDNRMGVWDIPSRQPIGQVIYEGQSVFYYINPQTKAVPSHV